MARVTYFVVLPYERSRRGRVAEGQPISVQSAEHARRMAARIQHQHAGVVAFSREGDPDFGDWDEAVVLAAYGDLPDEVARTAADPA